MSKCEMCNKIMNQEDYDYCDICGDCLEDEGGFTI